MNNKTITRHFIKSDIRWFQGANYDELITIDDINAGIDQWKNILAEQANFNAGSSLANAMRICDVRYLTLFFAGLELGGNLIVTDHPTSVENAPKVRCRVLAPFDVYVYDHKAGPETIAVGELFSNSIIKADAWFNYVSTEYRGQDKFLPTNDTTMLKCTTSGSTGVPKIVAYPHAFLVEISDRMAKLWNYNADDRVLHLSTMHHGGSSSLFFFPTLKHCRDHFFEYGISLDRMQEIVNLVVREKITKIFFPHSHSLDCFLKLIPRIDHRLDLFSIQALSKSWISLIKEKNIHSISTTYGCTETLGSILINRITQNDTEEKDMFNYGKPLDDYYSITLIPEQGLKVVTPYLGTHLITDKFTINDQGEYIFHNRLDRITINDVILTFGQLETICNQYLEPNFGFLIPDTFTNKIYLLCDNGRVTNNQAAEIATRIKHDLKQINTVLELDVVEVCPLVQFFDTVKLNPELAKSYIRKKYNFS